jgi:hypothetical protein
LSGHCGARFLTNHMNRHYFTIAFCSAAIILSASQSFADIIAGPITNPANGHDYYLLTPDTWTHSEAEAEVLGGTLAIIKNTSEQDWVFSTFSKSVNGNGLWIGLHRRRMGGPFVWVTSVETNYFDWANGEPNNSGGVENCVQMRNGPSDNGTWNDLSDDNLLNGIVELPRKTLSRSERALIGNWYVGGNLQRPCWITGTDTALFVILNYRFAARAFFCADGTLLVDGWTTDSGDFSPFPGAQIMRGKIIEDKILWSNGIWWSREPSK